ncbi:MAG: hypothetical protein RLW87_21000 [Alphaproteobacteria bacterium]|jgi:hypothetical protein|uniref:hypothetical protein n=1 Tax=Pacificispira sp. TaxID=2888761 RepID=UPI0029697CB6|nr:hypothetical protein [Alphaproteobacteria bacterium]
MTSEGRPEDAVPPAAPRAFPSWLTKRRILMLAGAAVVGLGLVLNWSWLTAIGAAPILLTLAPCLAMCALGLCMRGGGTAACQTRGKPSVRTEAPDVIARRSEER